MNSQPSRSVLVDTPYQGGLTTGSSVSLPSHVETIEKILSWCEHLQHTEGSFLTLSMMRCNWCGL